MKGSMSHKFPDEYIEMAFEAYYLGHISLSKLAELLEIPLEEAKTQLEARNIPIDLGVSSELELLSDIKNAWCGAIASHFWHTVLSKFCFSGGFWYSTKALHRYSLHL